MSGLLQRVAKSIVKQSSQLGQQARLVSTQSNSTQTKGLTQFFENGASLPEQTWTGMNTRTRGGSTTTKRTRVIETKIHRRKAPQTHIFKWNPNWIRQPVLEDSPRHHHHDDMLQRYVWKSNVDWLLILFFRPFMESKRTTIKVVWWLTQIVVCVTQGTQPPGHTAWRGKAAGYWQEHMDQCGACQKGKWKHI
jgi:hypothetical protein